MRPITNAIATVVLLALAAPIYAGESPSGLCPTGFNEMFNVNQPGCTFCYAPTDCNIECLGPPACFCSPGNTACCEANPCCDNCPEPMPLRCSTSSCSCAPDTCCSTVCPPIDPAPTNSKTGLVVLAAMLIAFGVRTLARRQRL